MSERFHSGYLNSATSFENSVVEDINIFRPESHVAQQRRRDKLRNNQQIVSTTDHLQDIHNHLLQFPNHCRVNADPATLTGERNSDLVYDTAMFSSEMLNFPMPRHPLYARFKDSVCSQEIGGDHQSGRLVGLDDASLGSSSHVVSSRLAPSARVPHYTGYWKGVGPAQQSSDWIVNYVSQAGENACSQNPLLVGECLPSTMKEPNLSSSSNYMKSGCNAYQDVNMASASTSQVYQKQCGDLNFNSTLHNALQTDNPRNLGSQGCEMARLVQQNMRGAGNSSWLDGESDSDIRPTYENVVHASRLCDPDRSMYRSVEGGSGKLGMGTNKSRLDGDNFVGDPSSRGLSLSLSSHPSPTVTVAHFGENFESENLLSRSGVIFNGLQDSKSNNSGQLYSYSKASVICNGEGNSVQGGVASSAYTRRNIGPLGPFTGYATILKNSKFLKPAQQLLDEICLVNGSKHKKMSELSETGSREMSISSNAINLEDDACGKGGTSGFSSTSFNSSNEAVGEGGSGTGSSQPHRPRIQQKKAKLLFMQEEVCRRYKLYHQQMQMAVSSFESVVGLSSATPYTSLALKTVSRHFRTLKNAISDQLRNISKALGEDLLSPSSANSSKGDMDFSRFRCINQNLQKQKAGGNDSLSFLEPQQPIWRPQRGLPERAVTVLRAWLFEHFLHPYPTDTDKHMLASQTGLSRNQVSNWFINARVRVWKPMVEEMHMLETNGSTEMELNSMRNNQKLDTDIVGNMNDCSSSRQKIDQMSDKQPRCSSANDVHSEDGMNLEEWSKEKRSRIECHTTGVDGGLMGFLPYHHSGLGAVSLTLGLRHSTDQQQQQQQQQREHQLSRHYGGHMIHDFVG